LFGTHKSLSLSILCGRLDTEVNVGHNGFMNPTTTVFGSAHNPLRQDSCMHTRKRH